MVMLALGTLSGCAWLEPSWLDIGSRCGGKASAELASVDWNEAASVPIVISSGEFQPMVIDLRRDRPYRLTIENHDDETRIFYAPGFFHEAAIGAVRVDGEGRDDTCLGQLILPPAATAEIRLAPRRRGRYELADSLIPLDVWGAGLGVIRIE
jgi:hypothetical protein